MKLHEVHIGIQRFKKIKRRGRGIGSGHGKTATRGHKGQFGRSGVSFHPAFQGGAMPLVRRIPKRGFFNSFALSVGEVNLSSLETHFAAKEPVTPDTLKQKSLLKRTCDVVKILGMGDLTKPLNVSAHRFSASAKAKIEKAGGQATILTAGPAPVVKGAEPKKPAKKKSAAKKQ
jgi:large subunit ribosomal protein L15